MTGESTPLSVAIAGASPENERWGRYVRAAGGVPVVAGSASQRELTETLAAEPCAAVIFTAVTPDLPGAIRAAALAGCDVCIAVPAALTSSELASLAEIARRRGRIIHFEDGMAGDERLRFIKRMARGSQALWRTRYLRSLRTDASLSIDEMALSEIALALEVLGAAPERVMALAPSAVDETEVLQAAMVAITLQSGVIATLHLSALEPERRRETTIVCDGRTVVLDAYDARKPMQIHASARHGGPQQGTSWGEVISEFPVANASADPSAVLVDAFLQGVRARDGAFTNCAQLATSARIWEAARRSIASGGQPEELLAAPEPASRPALRLIAGGGHTGIDVPAPRLTVVRAEPIPMEPAGTPA